MDKLVAFLLMAVLIIIGIYFLNENKFNGPTFSLFTIGLIILFLAFHSIDRLKEFNISEMKLVLSEMNGTKSDFDERVAVLLETLSELNIDYTVNEGMMIAGPSPDKLVKTRETSKNMLSLAGKTDKEIDRQLDKIDNRVLAAYASRLVEGVLKNSETIKSLNKQDSSNVTAKLREGSKKFFREESSPKSDQIDDFQELLKSQNIEDKFYKEYIDDMRYFLRDKKLRRPFDGYLF